MLEELIEKGIVTLNSDLPMSKVFTIEKTLLPSETICKLYKDYLRYRELNTRIFNYTLSSIYAVINYASDFDLNLDNMEKDIVYYFGDKRALKTILSLFKLYYDVHINSGISRSSMNILNQLRGVLSDTIIETHGYCGTDIDWFELFNLFVFTIYAIIPKDNIKNWFKYDNSTVNNNYNPIRKIERMFDDDNIEYYTPLSIYEDRPEEWKKEVLRELLNATVDCYN